MLFSASGLLIKFCALRRYKNLPTQRYSGTHTYAQMHKCTHANMLTCICTYTYTHTHTCARSTHTLHAHTHTHTDINAHIDLHNVHIHHGRVLHHLSSHALQHRVVQQAVEVEPSGPAARPTGCAASRLRRLWVVKSGVREVWSVGVCMCVCSVSVQMGDLPVGLAHRQMRHRHHLVPSFPAHFLWEREKITGEERV